jgi:cyanate lyase
MLTRADVTRLIVERKTALALTWASLAETIRASPAWATAALLGQMTLERADAEVIAAKLGLPAEASLVLQQPPSRGSLDTAVPTDPLIYRFYELVQVYGTTFKALIHEEFGDGIMSAIDFDMQIERQPDPKGDRVRIVMSGKFLPYKRY